MSGVIYCFSPTGTSLAVAGRLKERFLSVKVKDITDRVARERRAEAVDGALFTLIFPVYAHGVPGPVCDWLRCLPRLDCPACVICTYGSVSPGGALREAARLLEQKGAAVLGAAELPGPHAYRCARTARDLSRAGETDLDGAADFYAAVLEKAAAGGTPVTLPWRPDPARLLPQRLLGLLAARYPAPDLKRCHGCGACKRVCPTGAAARDGTGCIRCAACVRACPTQARALRFRCGIPPLYLSLHMKKRPPRFYV